MLLKGKTAVVTGANRGIGHAIVKDFVKNGADVFACSRSESEDFLLWCEKIGIENGVKVIPVFFDMSDSGAMQEAFKKIKASAKKVDILEHAAAYETQILLSHKGFFHLPPLYTSIYSPYLPCDKGCLI